MLMNRLFQGIGGFQNALTVGPTPAGSRSTPYLGQPLGGMPGQGMGQGLGGMPGQSQPLQQYGQYLEKTYDNFDGKRNAFLSNVREQEQNTFGQSQRPQNQFTGLESQQPYNRDQFNANNIGQLGDSQPLEAFKSFFNQGGEVPRQTEIMGQPHRLAYVNPQEEQMMLNQGGAGAPGPGGIPAYWTLTEPSTWFGGSNYEKGAGYQGTGNFNASDNDNDSTSYTDTSSIAGISEASGVNYTGNDDNDQNVGFIDSIAMGTGFKDKTPAYYNTTAQTIAASQGQDAAKNYLNNLFEDGTISSSSHGVFSNAASKVSKNSTVSSNDDNTVVVDDGTVDDGTVDDGTVDDGTVDGEEEIQYTQMKPFYGGYQPSTRADTLVPSQGRGIGSYLPNPRLDPIFPQQPPPDFYHTDGPGFPPIDGPGYGKTFPPGYDGSRPVPFDFGAPANLGDTYYNPELDTTYTYQEKPNGQGGFYSGWDITQGTGGEYKLYDDPNYRGDGTNFGMVTPQINPLTGLPQTAPINNDLSAQGVGNLFGNEQAPQSMYQGIMG